MSKQLTTLDFVRLARKQRRKTKKSIQMKMIEKTKKAGMSRKQQSMAGHLAKLFMDMTIGNPEQEDI